MIQVSAISKVYGHQALFDDATFSVNSAERIGVVGRNGHGKSTLFRLLTGREEPDSGEIHFPEHYTVGYLDQHLKFTESNVVREAALGLPEQEGGWQETYKAEAVLQGLGFSSDDFKRLPSELSGGYQVRLNLAKLLLSEPNLLLLDEPTNYLDIVSLRWLGEFMKTWPRELMLITHDHEFMDAVTTHTLGIHRGKIRKVEGTTIKYYSQLELEEEVHERSRKNQEKKIRQAEVFIRTFRAKASKAKAVQSRVKAVERMDTIEKLDEIEELEFSFTYKSFPGKQLLRCKNIGFAYAEEQETLFRGLSFNIGARDRIGVIGRNGKGKSTLLRVLAGELTSLEGEIVRSPSTELAYFGQTNVQRLTLGNTIEQELLAVEPTHNRTHARSVAGAMMFEGDAALKKIKVLSGGEKSRVLLGKILLTPANLILLDEPNNHLDMHSTEALLEAVHQFPGAVLIVTHSEHLLRELVNRLIVFDRGTVDVFEGSYDDFINRIGWADEGDKKEKSDTVQRRSQLSKKEARRMRAEIVKRRSRELKPLQEEIAGVEERIAELELAIENDTQTLIESTKDGFSEDAAKLSRSLNANKVESDLCYEKLEELMQKIEEKEQELDKEADLLN